MAGQLRTEDMPPGAKGVLRVSADGFVMQDLLLQGTVRSCSSVLSTQ